MTRLEGVVGNKIVEVIGVRSCKTMAFSSLIYHVVKCLKTSENVVVVSALGTTSVSGCQELQTV